ncbi:DUF5753 domain-containing protein [Micromonospora sp. FIMYZ51]|uniref:DUF5753 domain-containing protein n=1 Tax=Micromonospora sp. FIMYZ51 TaxID=3051832 RepID=UPI00311D7EC7
MATENLGATIARRRLRLRLRKLREENQYTLEQVRRGMEWSISKLVRIESGFVSIAANDLRYLLDYYGVTDADEVREMLELARQARQHHWAGEHRDLLTPAYMEFLGYEDAAVRASHFHPLYVPGLLQTPAYAHAIIEATATTELHPDEIASRVKIRQQRQARVLGRLDASQLRVAIDESALRRTLGNIEIMREQLQHLIQILERDLATIVVVPDTSDGHIGMNGPFSILEFSSPEDASIVYLDNARNDTAFVDEKSAVSKYKATFENLRRTADRYGDAGQSLTEMLESISGQTTSLTMRPVARPGL